MNGYEKLVGYSSIVLILCVVGVVIWTQGTINGYSREAARFQARLEQTVQVRNGEVDSPPLILPLNSEWDFQATIQRLNATTVYRNNWRFYVFNDNMTIAYRYITSGWEFP